MKCWPTMPVAPRMPTSIRVCIIALPFVDRFRLLRGAALWARALPACAPREWCRARSETARPTAPPNAGMSVVNATTVVGMPSTAPRRSAGISITSRSSARPSTARCEGGLGFGGIAHQADHDIGVGLVGDHVGRAAAGERADVERAGPEQGVDRQRDAADIGERVDQFVDGGIAQFRIGGVGHLAGGADFVAQRALAAERELVLGGLAVDDVARAARVSGRPGRRRRCCAPRPPRRAVRSCAAPAASSASTALIMLAMMPLVSQAPRPQMYSSSSREAKNGGTVSMWVESVTTSGSPHWAKTLKRRGSTSMRSTWPSYARRGGRGSRRGSCRPAPRCW